LLLAREVFPEVVGVDQADRLLAQVRRRESLGTLLAGSADRLPLASDQFAGVSMYALLHHLKDPGPALAEAHRVLAPGGVLYTDHDPNSGFGRFYRRWYRLRHRGRHGFGSELEDLAEYHNVYSDGLDPGSLEAQLRGLGFREVEVRLRHPVGPTRGPRGLAVSLLRTGARILPLRSLFTHFYILARK
ncbi:MAG: class I SAM-dependent methyltransferase, partial [Planctomycetes bacterium]|nr:class I SAM-dependent methyltransferase [Planctomycetota bacterium]